VFKDVDSIDLGDDFVEMITSAVSSCDALLALIGDRWVSITDESGLRGALGAIKGHIRIQFLAEAVLLADGVGSETAAACVTVPV
jgi:ABC-type antimicrobial peptide transport system permease subunit